MQTLLSGTIFEFQTSGSTSTIWFHEVIYPSELRINCFWLIPISIPHWCIWITTENRRCCTILLHNPRKKKRKTNIFTRNLDDIRLITYLGMGWIWARILESTSIAVSAWTVDILSSFATCNKKRQNWLVINWLIEKERCLIAHNTKTI